MKTNSIEIIMAAVIGGVFIAFLGHFVGQNVALAVIGAWAVMGLSK